MDNPRGWLSFRDPFYYQQVQEEFILFCGRSNSGPLSRRGCVGVMKWEEETLHFEKPLVLPMVYDDVECPCVFELNNRFYLLGSIREDIRVRYWVADSLKGVYRSFHSDVLLPQGNYAARVLQDGEHLIVYNFFFTAGKINSLRVLPPPKELGTDSQGRLLLKSFYRWNEIAGDALQQNDFPEPELLFQNSSAKFSIQNNQWHCRTETGYEIFYFNKPAANFIWKGRISNNSLGKFGLVAHMDKEGNGYFISFDLIEGLIQLRSWGYNPSDNKENFIFNNIQTNVCIVPETGSVAFELICYGNYIELSVNEEVKITLMDYAWSGPGMGLYTASSAIVLEDAVIKTLPDVENEYASQEQANKFS
jgi:beta-fructofuranosidase